MISAITAYLGPNGSGKTLSAVSDAIKWAKKLDRPIYSPMPITYEGVETIRLESLSQLVELDSCEIVLDEIVALAHSRDTGGLEPRVAVALQTLRHRDVGIYWTAPAWMRADLLLRECTQEAKVFKPVRQRAVEGQRHGQTLWSRMATYDTAGESGRLPRHESSFIPRLVRLRRLEGFGAYNSKAGAMTTVNETRYCMDCGHLVKRVRTYCECEAGPKIMGDLATPSPATPAP